MKIKLATVLMTMALAGADIAHSEGNALQTAQQYLDKGQAKAAIIELKNHLQANPDDVEARLLIGETYLRMGDGPAASKAFEKARELRAPKERWILSLGRAYLLQNDTRAILDQIKPDESLPKPLQAQILGLIGTVYTSKGNPAKAQENFDAALKLDPGASEALLGLGLLAADKGDYKKTIDYAKQVLAKEPKNLSAWVVLAEAERISGNNAAAAEAFGKAIEVRPADPRARLGRATAYLAENKVDEAAKDIAEVRKTAGEVPLALYLEAVIDYQKGKLDEAQDLLAKVATAMPDYLPAKLLIGTVAYQKNQFESAENALSAFNRAAPRHLPAAKLLAATRLKQNRAADAIPVLKAVESEAKNDPQFLSLLGTAYLQSRQLEIGNQYLAKAAALDPKAGAIKAQMALGEMASGKMDDAIKNLRSAVESDQSLHQAEVMLILALLQEKKFDEAIDAANKLKAKMKEEPMAENLLGAAYMAKGDADKAKQHWNAALELKPEYSTAGLNLARLEMSRKNPEGAVKHFEDILERDPKNLEALIGLASVAESKKDYAKMEEYLQKAREKNPDALQPALMLGRYYQATGKPLKALEIARDLSNRSPDNPAALQNLAIAQAANNQLPNAVLTFKKLVSKAPDNPEYRLQYVQILKRSGEMNQAVTELTGLVKAFPDYVPGQVAQAELALFEKRYDDALKLAQALQAKQPKQAAGFRAEGDVQFAQKQIKKGVDAYRKAYELEPSGAAARRLFLAQRTLGEDKAAFETLTQWLKGHEDDVESWLALAMAYQATQQNPEAITAYEKAYALKPDNTVILNNLAWMYQEAGDKRAVELAEKLLPSSENNPSVMDTVGWILVQNGKVDKGLTLLKEAAVHAPFQTEIRMHVVEALIKSGRKSDAKAELQKLLDEKKDFPDRKRAEELIKTL